MRQFQLKFGEAVRRALFTNYCNFDGRASRSEFWWYVLFTFILGLVVSIPLGMVLNPGGFLFGSVETFVGLLLLLPGLGVAVRRLHDIGKSGWWLLIGLIPLIGAIVLVVWYVRDSQPYPNEYGVVPNT